MEKPPTDREIAVARAAGARAPRATCVAYDPKDDAFWIELKGGAKVQIPRRLLRGPLRTADSAKLSRVELLGDGTMAFWPDLDEGLDFADVFEHLLYADPRSGSAAHR